MAPAKDDRALYLMYSLLDTLRFLGLNYSLCSDGKKWSELEKNWSPEQGLPCLFENRLEFVVNLLVVMQPHPLARRCRAVLR